MPLRAAHAQVDATPFDTASEMRLRISWGGGAARRWQGSISVSEGTLTEIQGLGLEADQPGSIWLEERSVQIHERTARTYDGLELTVRASLDAMLKMHVSTDSLATSSPVEIPLRTLLNEPYTSRLDDSGNRLHLRRAPGDELHVRFVRSSLIFSPGERFAIEVEPRLLGLPAGSQIQIDARLQPARSSRIDWSTEAERTVGANEGPLAAVPIELPIPNVEGVYDLVLTASTNRRPMALGIKQVLAERAIQFVVVDRQGPQRVPGDASQTIIEIDPANPKLWDRIAARRWLPGFRRGPLGNGRATRRDHALGLLVQLAESPGGEDASWEAYPLPVDRPGEPYVLEVDYPTDIPQALGISIVEPNAAGVVVPIGLDSGVYVSEGSKSGGPSLGTHRLVFWPSTDSPVALFTNRRASMPARYGKIRLKRLEALAGDASIENADGRIVANYFHRPLFCENFSASEAVDPQSGRSLDDWLTFYEGATRLIEHVKYSGAGAAVIAVYSDGSSLYPSRLLEPTPRFDTGAYFNSGQDPVRKDVLELLFRLFDREGLKLIPALDFAAPLPEVEELLRLGGPVSDGVRWIGADGNPRIDSHPAVKGRAPYYNPLNPRVADALVRVVGELVDRYGDHPSLGGLAIQVSGDSIVQLPGPDWGFDDRTIARFEHETRVRLPKGGKDRFATRNAQLTGPHREAWIQWRAETLAGLFDDMQIALARSQKDLSLYLTAGELLSGREVQGALHPSLRRTTSLAAVLRQRGLDPELYGNRSNVVFMSPREIDANGSVTAEAVEIESKRAKDLELPARGASVSGSSFWHTARRSRVASFEAKSPFDMSQMWLVTHFAPSGSSNRRRFIHALAQRDAQVMFDGGWLLPQGQEDSTRDLFMLLRRLPDTGFDTVSVSGEPVTVRKLSRGDDESYIYAVNDSPWSVTARLKIAMPAGTRVETLSEAKPWTFVSEDGEGATWSVALAPYDLAAARFGTIQLDVLAARAELGSEVRQELDERIRDVQDRAIALVSQPPLAVLENPSFELPASRQDALRGWATNQPAGTEVSIDTNHSSEGTASARIHSDGPTVSLATDPFQPPKTGRLRLQFSLLGVTEETIPPLRVALDYIDQGRYVYQPKALDEALDSRQESDGWTRYEFDFDRLPAEGMEQFRVRFDLMGPGEVHVDDVTLFDRKFDDGELKRLQRIVLTPTFQLKHGNLADCYRQLEGYWPQFLVRHVDPIARQAERPQRPPTTTTPQPKESEEAPGFMERIRRAFWR